MQKIFYKYAKDNTVRKQTFYYWMLSFNTPPQEVSIFRKVEINCERLDKVLILDYINKCPDNQGT
jgi:hypothetical protein